jgi:FtsP/CotA-like multicopper oxidase with cupredoxin domain
VPARLADIPPAEPKAAVNADNPRRFDLEDTADMVINGKLFEMGRIDERVRHGDTEVWEIRNQATDLMHPFHIHAGQFRIVSRSSGPVPPNEQGWKDVVRVDPGEKVRLLMTFDDAPGSYMYHCHILEHEDGGMMGTFAIDPR